MSRSGWKSWSAAVVGALALSGGIVVWYELTWGRRLDPESASEPDASTESAPEPDTSTDSAPEPETEAQPESDTASAPLKEAPPSRTSEPAPAKPPVKRVFLSHSADPCRPVDSPDLPSNYP